MTEGVGKKVLIVEDDKVFNQLIVKQLAKLDLDPFGVQSWEQAEAYLNGNEPALVLLDIQLPDADGLEILPKLASQYPVIVLTAYGSVQSAIHSMKSGASEYLMKPVNLDELEIMVQRALENAHLRQDCQFLRSQTESPGASLVGNSPAIREVMEVIEAVAPTDTTVLIQGESGVGKELVAREVHRRSLVSGRNFVPLDCCTLQENLFESELFGHERGAFTGADRQKKGMIEVADGGTLFLDEIGEISPAIQAKLLRVLETGTFRRLGGTKDLTAEVRIVAATNRDLMAMTGDATFRQDLYYRLSAIVITVPPLRDRMDDIPALIDHFIENHDFSRRISKLVGPEALEVLTTYDWPGNVRELKNVIERSIILSREEPEIRPEHLGLGARPADFAPAAEASADGREPTLEDIKRQYVESVYERHAGHRFNVAKALGISERNTYRLIKKYGLD